MEISVGTVSASSLLTKVYRNLVIQELPATPSLCSTSAQGTEKSSPEPSSLLHGSMLARCLRPSKSMKKTKIIDLSKARSEKEKKKKAKARAKALARILAHSEKLKW